MSLIVATRADARARQLTRFVAISAGIVNAMPDTPGNLGVRISNRGLVWYTLTAWHDTAALDAFVTSERHRHAMRAVDQLTRNTAFARIDTDVPFEQIPWDDVRSRLSTA